MSVIFTRVNTHKNMTPRLKEELMYCSTLYLIPCHAAFMFKFMTWRLCPLHICSCGLGENITSTSIL